MFSFFKKDNNTNIPQWASFFNAEEYSIFINEIEYYFMKLSSPYNISDGVINVEDNFFGFSQLGMMNVAQVCKQGDISEYQEIIREHFDALIRSHDFEKEFKEIKNDFSKIRGYLGVKLYDKDYFEDVGLENTVGRFLVGNIYAILIFDLPHSIVSIKPEEIKNWNQTREELINIGIQNIQEKNPVELTEETIDDFKIFYGDTDHFFAPNLIFYLNNRFRSLDAKGLLIAIPNRHTILIYPVKTLETVKVINWLIPAIYRMYQEGPGSLTSQLYFYKNEEFINLPYEIIDDKIQFYPPEKFTEVLNSLQ